MARKFLTHLDLAKNELQNGVIQNLGAAPSSPVKGQLYFNTTDNTLYWYDGTAWRSALGGGTGFPGFGNVTAEPTFGSASNNGAAATASRTDHQHGNPTHTGPNHSTFPLSTFAAAAATIDMGGNQIANVAVPAQPTDAANKSYVDNLAAGLSWKEAVRVASTANRALTGLTAVDGVTPIANDRVLLKNQTAPAENGIWLAQSGAWTRATDADGAGELEGATVFVMEGTTHADQAWTMTTNAPITVGTTGLTWVQFGAGTAYTAGNGLTLTGADFNVGAGTGITVAADTVALDTTYADGRYPLKTTSLTAGAGLTGGGDLSTGRTFDVGAGNGITVAADTVAVSYGGDGAATTASRSDHTHATTYTRKYYAALSAGTSTVLTHNLNTREASVTVYRNSTPYDQVDCDIEMTTLNTATVRFNTAISVGEYIAVVIG